MTALAPTLPATASTDGFGGLLALVEGVERALPLQQVRVRSHLVGGVARTVIEQVFAAPEGEVALEAVHIFPLPPDGAVTEVELVAGEVVVKAECREREQAEKVFAEAREQGHRAALLTAERADVHTLRVTNLPPGEEVRVRIVVIEALACVDGRFRWRFPTVVAPRYNPGTPTAHTGPGVWPDTTHVPDASRITPPIRLEGGTTLDLEVRVEGPVSDLASSLHAMRVGIDGQGVRIAPSQEATCDRDFVLAYSTGDEEEAVSRAWTDGKVTLVLVEPPTMRIPEALPRDAVFIIDVSGSMGGGKLTAAKRALIAALHGLMPGDRFQLIAFSSSMTAFRSGWTELTDQTLAAGDQWVEGLRANGGTEMLAPIQLALAGDTPAGRLRTVLFITDGQAGNESELVAAVHNRRQQARFFSLGIDSAVNTSLLERLARVGGGVAEFAAPGDDIEAIVASVESRFGAPMAVGIGADGALDTVDLFAGRPAQLWVDGAPETVVLAGDGYADEVTPVHTDLPLTALLARRRIARLEDQIALQPWTEEAVRPEIVRLAVAHHLASRFTAFVAVERSSAWKGGRTEVVQPVEMPHGWDMPVPGGPMLASMAPAPRGGARRKAMRSAPMKVGAPPPPMASSAPPPAPMRLDESLDMEMDAFAAEEVAAPRPAKKERAKGGVFGGLADAVSNLFSSGGAAPAEPEAAAAPADETGDVAGRLARTQSADGSFGGDVARTAAALLALVLLGHTRRTGLRKRTVLKAARWLEAHRGDALVDAALAALEQAERGTTPAGGADWQPLFAAGPEGGMLQHVVEA
ncbi:MAG: VWA domain-containing protein [Deltaproteobacteria bacterium]|nr:MAG: VWA domain-containing protein [Deltaproteobacteria bacterium]